MPFDAVGISVMIASPGDVIEEREIARRVLYDWNATHARDRSQILVPTGWEHSTPAMGDRPQELINKQILRDADILVAVFWTRLGTSTGKAASGTVEEIEEHIAAGRPALIYFSNKPMPPNEIDHAQHAAVRDFRTSLKERGLYQEFSNATDFQVKLTGHIARTIIDNFKEPRTSPSEPADYNLTLTQMQKEYLLDISRPRNSGCVYGRILEQSGRDVLAYQEALRTFELCDLMTFDGSVFKFTSRAWALTDQLWEYSILDAIDEQSDSEDLAKAVKLTDGKSEADQLRRFADGMAEKGWVRVHATRGSWSAEITPAGITRRRDQRIEL